MTPSQPAAAVPDRERAIRAIKILLFSASVVPSVVGGAIAHAAGSFSWAPIAVFFTPLMLRGWKEPVIFVTFGPLCITGVVFALTGALSEAALVASLPVGLFVTVVAYLKSARFDVVDSGGEQVVLKLSRTVILSLLALLAAPLAVATVRRTSLFADTANYTAAMTSAIALSSVSGILLCAGYGIAIALQ